MLMDARSDAKRHRRAFLNDGRHDSARRKIAENLVIHYRILVARKHDARKRRQIA
jgi:hypothetical protein